METIKITFGDYWNDGHGKYKDFTLLCNRTPQQLKELEPKAEQYSGYKFQTNGPNLPAICNGYEDSVVGEEVIKDLVSKGFDNKLLINGYTHPLHELQEGIDDFAEFFMRWLKMVDPELQWKWAEDDTPNVIFNCRGYGMFY